MGFKNKVTGGVGTTPTTIYSVPADTVSTLIGLSVANILTENITVEVTLTDTSESTTVHLIKNAPVPVGSTLIVCGGDQKIVLETTDQIRVKASNGTAVDVVLSMLEQSAT